MIQISNIKNIIKFNRTSFLLVLLILIIVLFSLLTPHFFSVRNLLEITQFGAPLALIALGEALIILAGKGGIDLSVGSILSLTGVIFGLAVTNGVNMFIALIITAMSGVILGGINGVLIAYIGLPPMISTLGTMYAYGSLALYFTGGVPISGFPRNFSVLSQGYTFGIPNQVLFVVVPIAILTYLVVNKTAFGRKIYLTGTNDEAAKLATIDTSKLRMYLYVYSGLLSSIASIIMCSWLMTAKADVGKGLEMKAITASVLGGISIKGGEGRISGVLLAILIITITSSGLQIANINSIWELSILGLILITIVALDGKFATKKA